MFDFKFENSVKNIQIEELQDRMLEIKNQFLFKPLSKLTFVEIKHSITKVLAEYGLVDDVCYLLDYNRAGDGIELIPIKPVDKILISVIFAKWGEN